MTPYEQAIKGAEELATSAQEILANLKSVRGQEFSDAVAAAFEVRQLVDIFARISGANKDNEFITKICVAGIELSASIGSKTTGSLGDDDLKEVFKLADQLYDRRSRILSGINKGN
jgi:hypothetical protein